MALELYIIGFTLTDYRMRERVWTVTAVYAPVLSRQLGGVRIKLTDQKGVVTFCNQRDFEVMTEMAKPGDWCAWTGAKYPGPDDQDWIGFFMDETDLEDDLYERELALRAEHPKVMLPQTSEIWRRLHLGGQRIVEECWVLINDFAVDLGYGPDTRLETIPCRWSRASRDWYDTWAKI